MEDVWKMKCTWREDSKGVQYERSSCSPTATQAEVLGRRKPSHPPPPPNTLLASKLSSVLNTKYSKKHTLEIRHLQEFASFIIY